MSYPPPRHVLSDLRAETRYADGIGEMRAPIRQGVIDEAGAMSLGILATIQDVTGAVVALPAVQPDWIATSHLSIEILEPLRGDGVLVRCRCVRVGSKSVVVECEAFSIDTENVASDPSAVGLMLFARIPGSASVAEPTYSDSTGWSPLGLGVESDLGLLDERLAIRSSQAGSVVDADGYVSNSFGTVNGGVQCALACYEAQRIAVDGSVCTDLQLHYLAQVGDGPLVAVGTVLRSRSAETLVGVRLHDEANGRLIALATVHCSKP